MTTPGGGLIRNQPSSSREEISMHTTTFAQWLRATGHTHQGLTARALLQLWRAQR